MCVCVCVSLRQQGKYIQWISRWSGRVFVKADTFGKQTVSDVCGGVSESGFSEAVFNQRTVYAIYLMICDCVCLCECVC